MLSYVLRCSRVPIRAGKVIRHALRRHLNIGHRASHVIYHTGAAALGTMLVCVAVPLALLPPAVAPPESTTEAPPSTPSVAPRPTDRAFIPPEAAFVPGLLFFPPQDVTEFPPADVRLLTEDTPQSHPDETRLAAVMPALPLVRDLPVPEPSSLWVFAFGVMVLAMLRRAR